MIEIDLGFHSHLLDLSKGCQNDKHLDVWYNPLKFDHLLMNLFELPLYQFYISSTISECASDNPSLVFHCLHSLLSVLLIIEQLFQFNLCATEIMLQHLQLCLSFKASKV